MKESILRTLRLGMTDPQVGHLKKLLNGRVPDTHLHASNSTFGPDTQKAVCRFQASSYWLEEDGVCGPNTWKALLAKDVAQEFQDGVKSLEKHLLHKIRLQRKSIWKFKTSSGGAFSVDVGVGLGAEVGKIYLTKGESSQEQVVKFVGGAVIAGFGPPADYTFSTKDMMSIGEIRLGFNRRNELASPDFSGPILALSMGFHLDHGLNVALTFFGAPIYDFAPLLLAPQGLSTIALERIWNDAKAVALIESHVFGFAGASVGLMAGTAWV